MKISPPSSLPYRMRPLWSSIVLLLSQRDPGLAAHHLPLIEQYCVQSWILKRQAMALRKMPELVDDISFLRAQSMALNGLRKIGAALGLDVQSQKWFRPVGQPPDAKHAPSAANADTPSVADILASLHDSPGPRDTLQ